MAIRKQRRGQREGLRLVPPLVTGGPERAADIERVEDHIASRRRVELSRVFERRVVDDGRLAAGFYLLQQLPNQHRLARPGIADDQKVTRFERLWHAEPRP